MDAEKMAREWLELVRPCGNFVTCRPDEPIQCSCVMEFATLLTTAHNTGLERAAEIVQSVGQDWLNNADYPLGLGKASRGHAACSNAAQAIRREMSPAQAKE